MERIRSNSSSSSVEDLYNLDTTAEELTQAVADRFIVVDTNIKASPFSERLDAAKIICLCEHHLDDGAWRTFNSALINWVWKPYDLILVECDGKDSTQLEGVDEEIKDTAAVACWDKLRESSNIETWELIAYQLVDVGVMVVQASLGIEITQMPQQAVLILQDAIALCSEVSFPLPTPDALSNASQSWGKVRQCWMAIASPFSEAYRKRLKKDFIPRQKSMVETIQSSLNQSTRKIWVIAGSGHFRPNDADEEMAVAHFKSTLTAPYLILHPKTEEQSVENPEKHLAATYPKVTSNDPVEPQHSQGKEEEDPFEGIDPKELAKILAQHNTEDPPALAFEMLQSLFRTWDEAKS